MKELLTKKSEELVKIIQQQEMQALSLEEELQRTRNNIIYYKGRYEQVLDIIKEIPKETPDKLSKNTK